MKQDKLQSPAYETLTARERIENRIGKTLAQKYREEIALSSGTAGKINVAVLQKKNEKP